jgi:hypothetical protein
VADGIVGAISPRTVRQVLAGVDLQPHRTRYWRTPRLDERFKDRAEKVLWCYGNAGRLARDEGVWTVAVDEVPNCQVLEREPVRRAVPGSIERQEFEYVRHGTVNLLLFLVVHTGRMEVVVEDRKDAAHYVSALRAFRRRHRHLAGAFLVHDGDPSHTARATGRYLRGQPWWRPRLTPAHASWLNQAELLVGAFKGRYLKRASWHDRDQFIEHVLAAGPEYNRTYAHPFEWTWTNQRMRKWYADHAT